MLSNSKRKRVEVANTIARLLDIQYSVFGVRIGFDAILGIVPGLGDVIAAFFSLYILYAALSLNVPRNIIIKMVINIFLDFVLGLIPVLGSIADIFFRANMRNIKLLNTYLEDQQ